MSVRPGWVYRHWEAKMEAREVFRGESGKAMAARVDVYTVGVLCRQECQSEPDTGLQVQNW